MARGKGAGPGRPKEIIIDYNRMTQEQVAEAMGIQPSTVSRWKKAHRYGCWNDDGTVDFIRLQKNKAREDRDELEQKIKGKSGSKAEEMGKIAKAEDAMLTVQLKKGETVYVPDILAAFQDMGVRFRDAQRKLPRTLAPKLMTWLAGEMAEQMKANPEIGKALQTIKQGTIERWLDQQFDQGMGDLGAMMANIIPSAIDKAKKAARS